jgi:hypothetical protein
MADRGVALFYVLLDFVALATRVACHRYTSDGCSSITAKGALRPLFMRGYVLTESECFL